MKTQLFPPSPGIMRAVVVNVYVDHRIVGSGIVYTVAPEGVYVMEATLLEVDANPVTIEVAQ